MRTKMYGWVCLCLLGTWLGCVERGPARGVARTTLVDGTTAIPPCVDPVPAPFAHASFQQTWNRGGAGDKYWGPVTTGTVWERYAEAPDGYRLVQYFQKTRMEINDPCSGNPSELWYVTSGHLVREMIRGQIQVGNSAWENRDRVHDLPSPADIQIAGDPLAPGSPSFASAPTYASLSGRQADDGDRRTQQIDRRLYRDGHVDVIPAPYVVPYGQFENGHNVATPFQTYRAEIDAATNVPGAGLHLVGLAITNPYWVRVPVGGTEQWVLVQAFERRVLTYTPSNPSGWQIEMGNVGLHYVRWRYNNNAIVEGQRRGDFVTVKNGHFLLDGKPFRHVGVNMSGLIYQSPDQVALDLDALPPLNIRHIRVFLPNDTYDTPGLVEKLNNILNQAGGRGIKVTVVLAHNYYQPVWAAGPESWGPYPPSDREPRFFPRGDRGSYLCYASSPPTAANDGCGVNNMLSSAWFQGGYKDAYRQYVQGVVGALKDHSAVFSWEIANEVKDPLFWEGDNLARYIRFYEDMAQIIKDADPNHLVAAGLINAGKAGLSNDPSPNGCILHTPAQIFYGNPNIDYLSVHTYSDDGFAHADRELARKLHKPWIIEEAGFCVTLPDGDRDDCTATGEQEWNDPQHEMERLFGEAYNASDTYPLAADAVMVWGVHFGTLSSDRRYGPSEQDKRFPGQMAKYKEMWTRWGAELNNCNNGYQGTLQVLSPGGQRLQAGSQQTITWSSNDPSITEVQIQAHDGASWRTVANAPNTGAYSWTVPSVTTDRAYVRVSDVRDYSKSDLSSSFAIGQPVAQVPLRVVLPTAETIFPVGGRIELKFQAPAGRIGVFYQSSTTDNWTTHNIGYVNVTQNDPNAIYLIYWNNVPPSPTQRYRVVIWIEGSDGADAAYSPFASTSQVLAPVAPSAVAATATSTVSMRVTWQDNSGDEASFAVERRKQGETAYTVLGSVGPNVTSYTASGLEPGATYCFRVSATNRYGTTTSGEGCGTTQVNVATFVSQSVPATMTGGQPYTVSVTMRNDGTSTWTRDGATPYRLGAQPQDTQLWVTARAGLSAATVPPGGLATFTFQVTAPSTPGTYTFQWRMVQETIQWFSGATPAVSVNVTKGVSPLYASLYARNWPTGDGLRTQWSDLTINNPNDLPAVVTIRIQKRTGGLHAVIQQAVPAHGMWSSYGQAAWTGVPFTDPNADATKSASFGWLDVGSDRPVIVTQRFTFRNGNAYSSPVDVFQDQVLGTETGMVLGATYYLKNWPSSEATRSQWSNLVLVNPNCCAAANVTIDVHKTDGTGLVGSISQSIAPGAIFGTYGQAAWNNMMDANPHIGWVEVRSDRPIFGTNRVTIRTGATYDAPVAFFQDEPLSGAVNRSLGSSFFLKNWPSSGGGRQESNLTLVNPGRYATTATIRVYEPDGNVLASFSKYIAAGAWWNASSDPDWTAIPNTDLSVGGALGWVEVTSTLPIFGLNRKTVRDGTTLLALDDEPLTTPLPSAGYASLYVRNWPAGSGTTTQWSNLMVSNPQPTSTWLSLNVYGIDGTLLKTVTKRVVPYGSWSSDCDPDWLSVPATASFSTGPASLGWLEVVASQPVRASNRVAILGGNTCDAPVIDFDDVELVTKQP